MKNKIFGYCRVSTKTQNIERQIQNIIRAYPEAIIKQEKVTGTKLDVRTEFKKLLKIVKPGDTIVFDSVSRMSRNAEEGFKLYQELYNNGIELIFLKENYINTSTYKAALKPQIELRGDKTDILLNAVNEYLMELAKEQIQIAFTQAEKEVKDLQQRTKEGIEVARAEGKQIGRASGTTIETDKSKEAKKLILKHSKKFNGTLSNKECMALVGVAKATFYKYVEELDQEANRDTEATKIKTIEEMSNEELKRKISMRSNLIEAQNISEESSIYKDYLKMKNRLDELEKEE